MGRFRIDNGRRRQWRLARRFDECHFDRATIAWVVGVRFDYGIGNRGEVIFVDFGVGKIELIGCGGLCRWSRCGFRRRLGCWCGLRGRRRCRGGRCCICGKRSKRCRSGGVWCVNRCRRARGRHRFGGQQMLDAVEDFLARPTTHQAGAQLQLVMRDAKGRMTVRALGCEGHVVRSGLLRSLAFVRLRRSSRRVRPRPSTA